MTEDDAIKLIRIETDQQGRFRVLDKSGHNVIVVSEHDKFLDARAVWEKECRRLIAAASDEERRLWERYLEKRLAPLGQSEVQKGIVALRHSRGGMLLRVAAFAILEGAGVLTKDEWNAGLLTVD